LDILQKYDDDISAILPSAQRVLGRAHDMMDGCDQYSVSLFIIYNIYIIFQLLTYTYIHIHILIKKNKQIGNRNKQGIKRSD
jgi:hypothetical protein